MSHYRREIDGVRRFETEDVLVLFNKRFCAMSMISKTQLYNTKEVLLLLYVLTILMLRLHL